ncbi:MAG: hypothetical protein II961_01490 [Candidatus Riflebacteria bacterium]|nr:hypothetical protein [Candidatus Riflebacteria bacterium]
MNKNNKKTGQALLAILIICLFLGIISCALLNIQSSQINLLSRSAREYVALSVAESGLHCVLAEMKADYQFVTHGNPYIPADGWPSSSQRRFNYVGSSKYLKIKGNSKGVYEGTVDFPVLNLKGEFKVRIKLMKSKNSTASKSVDEAHRYFLLESYGRVGDTCRKITTIIEKIVPGNFLLYDGQVLDTGGYGPYRVTPGLMTGGRLYGHEMIVFSKKGAIDAGSELKNTEKIYTPGYIKAETRVGVEFFGGKKGEISPRNDSTDPDKFESFAIKLGGKITDRFMLDGNHGAKPQLLPPLNPSYYREAKKPHPEILKANSSFEGFKESKWRNPEKPSETVYDLFFGWDYKKEDKDFLIYSEVPLRVWGCPKWKALTIFCEKDVYIAGDFNANPDSPQRYNMGYRDYAKQIKNGTDKNGCQIMSMGRIWFDYSNPMNFLRNEMEVVMDYDLACCLSSTEEPSGLVLKGVVWPPRTTTGPLKHRLPMAAMNFTHIHTLYNMPKEEAKSTAAIAALVGIHPALSKLRSYISRPKDKDNHGSNFGNHSSGGSSGSNSNGGANGPIESISRVQYADSIGGADGAGIGGGLGDDGSDKETQKTHFPIKNVIAKARIIETIGVECYLLGVVPPGTRDKVIKILFEETEKEMDKDEQPNPDLGPWNIADRMFKLQVKHKDSGLRFPEMTVNAMLIDSAQLNSNWNFGNNSKKINNELGNVQNSLMRSFPWAHDRNTRLILKHNGSMIHLRNRKVKEFIKGVYFDDQPIIRQISFDQTYANGGGDYFPPYPIAGFTIINWLEEYCSEEEFNKVN